MPFPVEFFNDGLEGGHVGRSGDGTSAWELLRRMLLVFDVSSVCDRGDESLLDNDSHFFCSC